MDDPHKLRKLAAWYRELAERAGNPSIWHGRLTTAEELEREADRLEKIAVRGQLRSRNGTAGRAWFVATRGADARRRSGGCDHPLATRPGFSDDTQ
jgi:hypothetical protein